MNYQYRRLGAFLGILGLLITTACNNDNSPANLSDTGSITNAVPDDTIPNLELPKYKNIFTYCEARETLDKPGGDYTGSALPEVVNNSLQQQLAQAEKLPEKWDPETIQWRCMANKVYACTPLNGKGCDIKLDFSRAGNRDMQAYCQQKPNSTLIPDNVVSQASAYNWLCDGEKAAVKSQRSKADQAGFNAAMWFLIENPDTETTNNP